VWIDIYNKWGYMSRCWAPSHGLYRAPGSQIRDPDKPACQINIRTRFTSNDYARPLDLIKLISDPPLTPSFLAIAALEHHIPSNHRIVRLFKLGNTEID